MLSAGPLVIIAIAVIVGATLQRLSGTGVGLVVSPVLSILLGPSTGVLVANMTTVVSGFLIMLTVWSAIDWRKYALIAPAAIVGSIPAALLVGALPAGWLSILLGGVVVFALIVTFSLRTLPEWKGRGAILAAGALGGFFNTTSGVA
uniref:TSUP family transporter n=1 Tax=Dietzia sp. TaxID=1871616 RepID=UPI002FDAE96C